MSFNNGRERRKFEKAWEILRKEYQEAGMDEESIEKMYQYDSLLEFPYFYAHSPAFTGSAINNFQKMPKI